MANGLQHYVPRSILKSWVGPHNQVCFYRFSTDSFGMAETYRRFFALDDIFTPQEDSFLQKKIEAPLGDFITQLGTKYASGDIQNWKVFRAIYLFILTQSHRFSAAAGNAAVASLKTFIAKGTTHIDQLIQAFMEKYSLILLQCPEGHIMCLPESGYFILPILDRVNAQDYGEAFFAPLTPCLAIGMAPKMAPQAIVEQQADQLMAHSVTANDGIDVVVLPYSGAYTGEQQEVFKHQLKEFRARLKAQFAMIGERRKIVGEFYKTAVQEFI